MVLFFVGLDKPNHAQHFDRCMISVKTLRDRKSGFVVNDWMLDSGAFTELFQHGHYRDSVGVYADQIRRFKGCGNMLSATSQDYMCESFILEKTGLSIPEHQRLTIERYDALLACDTGAYILPVLQGYAPHEYVEHIRQYGDRLQPGAWVGVGSVCKRNTDMRAIEAVLCAIKSERSDLRLHGFGVKTTALKSSIVQDCLYTADSMAWSFAARITGGDAHDWRNAVAFCDKIDNLKIQSRLLQRGIFD